MQKTGLSAVALTLDAQEAEVLKCLQGKTVGERDAVLPTILETAVIF